MNIDIALAKGAELSKQIGLINIGKPEICAHLGISINAFSKDLGCSFFEYFEKLKESVDDPGPTKASRKRTDSGLRKDNLLNTAVAMAAEVGFNNIDRISLATRAEVSPALISKYFGTLDQLKNDVMRRAVKTENLTVIAQGLAAKNRHAQKASEELQTRALRCLISA